MTLKSAHKDLSKHISESRTAMSCCNIPKHVNECGTKNSNFEGTVQASKKRHYY